MPLRVLYFAGTHGDWGGASRVLFATLALLDRARIEPIVALSGAGPAQPILDQMAVDYVVWGPMNELRSWTQYMRRVIRTTRWLRQRAIDVIDMNRANDWRPAEHLAARLAGIPIVTHFHTVNVDRAPATRLSAAIAAVSRYVAEHSDTLGVPVHVIHNAVDIARFGHGKDIRPEFGIPTHAIVVTFAGQIRTIKGIDRFVAAARQVVGRHVKFLIVGACRTGKGIDDAYDEDELGALISGDGRIIYGGYRTDMADVYRSSDIVVMPSQWDEPFGLIAIEAGAARRPVVATRVGGIPEVVVDGVTGFLVQPHDVAGLAQRIQQLVESPELRESMGGAAFDRVRANFSDRPVRALERLYASLCTRRH